MRDISSTILLTGATGLVGRYLMRDLLLRGKDLIVLARSRGPVSGHDRVEAVIQDWEQKLGRRLLRPTTIEANINEAGLGLSSQESESRLRRCRMIVHCAASLRFEEDAAGEEPVRTNLSGTRHVVEFAREIGIPHFHHVSTAYVCGQRTGRIQESELDCGQAFHNIYEQSKFQAEQLIAEAGDFETKTVYRPSIIVGDSESGFSSTFHTVYSILRFLRALPDNHAANLDWVFQRLRLSGTEGKNLVPVNWVSQIMTQIIDQPTTWNKTFHLTHSRPTKVDQLSDAIAASVEKEWSAWEAMALPASLVDAQVAYQNHVDVYRGYLSDDPEFDTCNLEQLSAPEPPILSHDRLVKLMSYAIHHRFRDTTPALPRKLITEAFRPALDAASTSPSGLGRPIWTLRLSGAGGGVWKINGSQESDVGSSAWVHTTIEIWKSLLKNECSMEGLLAEARILFGGTPAERRPLKEELERLLNDCRNFENKPRKEEDSELPSVVPLRRKKEGRRHA